MSTDSDTPSIESASDTALTPFQKFFGYRVVEARDGFAVMEIDLREEFGNRTGRVHGGVVMTLIDSVGGYCGCADDEGNLPRRCVTLGASTNFLDVPTLVATGEGTYKYLKPRT